MESWETLISIVLPAIIGALPALLLWAVQVRRSKAEIDRLLAEAAKLRAEADRSGSDAVATVVAGAASELIDDLREQVKFQGEYNGERITLLEKQKEEEHRLVIKLQGETGELQEMLNKALNRIDVLEFEGQKKDAAIESLKAENEHLKVSNREQEQKIAELHEVLVEALHQIDELQQCNQRLEAELVRRNGGDNK